MSLLGQSQRWFPTHVQVVVLRARGLRAKGRDGTNDAFVIMQLGKEKYSSSVAEKSREPLWREEAEFELPPLLQQASPDKGTTLYLIVTHRALVGLDKFLGQAVIDLRELYHHKTNNKVGWHKLQSRQGKKEKERGEIEVDIRFVRNNMTASMFDLSMKDKSRSTLGKLKDKLKGKKKDGFSDSASAIVPSISTPVDSDDENMVAGQKKKKKSKLKMLFPKSNLQRTSLSQSMSVIPTGPSSPADLNKEARTFADEDFTEIQLHTSPEEEDASKDMHVPKIMGHKRSSSEDTKQLTLAPSTAGKKETLSLFSGLRPKSDPVSQSNLCINGSHVYAEEPNPILHSKPKSDSKLQSNSQFYASLEDLPSKLSPSPLETQPHAGFSDQALKSVAPPGPQRLGSTGDLTVVQRPDGPKEKDTGFSRSSGKEEEGGKNADSSNAPGAGSKPLNPFEEGIKEEERIARPVPKAEVVKDEGVTKKEEPKRGGLMSLFPRKTEAVKASNTKEPLNPFDTVEAKKPPSSSVWSTRTAAIKPKLDVSPKFETKANSLSSFLSDPSSPSSSAPSDPFSSAPAIGPRGSDLSSRHLTNSPPLPSKSDSLGLRPSRVDESGLTPSLLPLVAGSSSSSMAIDTQTNQLPSPEIVGGRPLEVGATPRQGSKVSPRLLLQELTTRGQNARSDQRSPSDGEEDSAIVHPDGSSQDVPLETIPVDTTVILEEGKRVGSEDERVGSEDERVGSEDERVGSEDERVGSEDERVGSEDVSPVKMPASDASQGKMSMDHPALINPNPVRTSTTSHPTTPVPKVPPRSSVPSSGAPPAPKPEQNVPPVPAPRSLPTMNKAVALDASSRSAEGQPLKDLMHFEWDAEPVTESAAGGGTDGTLAAGTPVNNLSLCEPQGDDHGGPLVATHKPEPCSISGLNLASPTEMTDDYPLVVVEEENVDMDMDSPSTLQPSGQMVLPEKMEHVAEDPLASELEVVGDVGHVSPPPGPPAPPAVTLVWQAEAQTSPDPNPDLTHVTPADSDHPANLQPVAIEPNDGNANQWLVNGIKGHDAVTSDKGGESLEHSLALTNKRESVELPMKDDRVHPELTANAATPATLEIAAVTLDMGDETFTGQELQASERAAVVSSISTPSVGSGRLEASPATVDSVGFLVPPLSPSVLSRPACPLPDNPPPAGRSHGVEHSGQKMLIQARVVPTETQPIHPPGNAATALYKRRLHPVKPMNAAETRSNEIASEENLKTKIKNTSLLVTKSSAGHSFAVNENQSHPKDYNRSDPASAYAQLTHDELIQLVLKQKELITKKDGHVRELENYIDNLLVRVMEETPNILRVACPPNRRAERV
ncbi:rab11 family-interacting protein 1-like [Amblyraja radiata]|uniref:rab11 family-interacting protein 1-like n=1 Tax=Amblyraja radiata TaxID=386614 RepID=UPI0014038CAF|nr:rab11 family-interacting protein 1-like [Amblyraja radiata]XP_032869999.1 rab11 family-interacting protein 1-like [Amblyraja radiata]